MIDVYVTLIRLTSISLFTIDNVPEQHKETVLEKLATLRLDGYGKPLIQG